ncbi:MAG: DivIVA domain-containing protein [Clostridia bacterium]|nr:DivIVA domain-containing protein [Clostridia bacterium]
MLTPSKIMNHHFEVAGKNAYRAHSVDEFFDIVAESYEQMFKENGELVKKISILAERLEEYKNDEDNIRNALLTAQRMADKIVKETNQKADDQLAEVDEYVKKTENASDEKASKLIEDARARASEIIERANLQAAELIKNATAEAKEQEVIARDRMIKAQAGLDLIEKEADKFKRELLKLYSDHLELINKIPEMEGSDEAVEVVEAVEQEDDKEDVKVYAPKEEEKAPAEVGSADDDDISVEEYLKRYTDDGYDADEEDAVEAVEDEEEPQYEAEDEEETVEEPEEEEYAEVEEEPRTSLADVYEAIDGEEVIDEPAEEEDDEDESDYSEPDEGDTFKFDLSAFKFSEDDDDDDSADEYYDDDDSDDDYFDDDDDDDDEPKGSGFSSKFKGFFKR